MVKTITFAILHFGVAFSVAYLLTGSMAISGAVALIEPIVNTVVFYFHEKAWNRYERNKPKKSKIIIPLHQCTDCSFSKELFAAAAENRKNCARAQGNCCRYA